MLLPTVELSIMTTANLSDTLSNTTDLTNLFFVYVLGELSDSSCFGTAVSSGFEDWIRNWHSFLSSLAKNQVHFSFERLIQNPYLYVKFYWKDDTSFFT